MAEPGLGHFDLPSYTDRLLTSRGVALDAAPKRIIAYLPNGLTLCVAQSDGGAALIGGEILNGGFGVAAIDDAQQRYVTALGWCHTWTLLIVRPMHGQWRGVRLPHS